MSKETENEIFDRVLIPFDMDFTPSDVDATFGQLSDEDLWRGVIDVEIPKVAAAIQQGWALIVLKKRLGHDHFQDGLAERGIPYHKANRWMNTARGCLRHPDLQKITSLKVLQRILRLPEKAQADIEIEITEAIGNGENQTWNDLRSWVVDRISAEKVSEVKRKNAAANRRAKKTVEEIKEDDEISDAYQKEDPEWVAIRRSFHEDALGGIGRFRNKLEAFVKRKAVLPDKTKREYFAEVSGGKEPKKGWMYKLRKAQDEVLPFVSKLDRGADDEE